MFDYFPELCLLGRRGVVVSLLGLALSDQVQQQVTCECHMSHVTPCVRWFINTDKGQKLRSSRDFTVFGEEKKQLTMEVKVFYIFVTIAV